MWYLRTGESLRRWLDVGFVGLRGDYHNLEMAGRVSAGKVITVGGVALWLHMVM
jgi:hypothetical protein